MRGVSQSPDFADLAPRVRLTRAQAEAIPADAGFTAAQLAVLTSQPLTEPTRVAPGVVLARSQRCGTDDRLGIVYQNGSTRLPGGSNPLLYWTGGSSADFVLDAAHLDGSALALPVPVLNATTVATLAGGRAAAMVVGEALDASVRLEVTPGRSGVGAVGVGETRHARAPG